MKIGNHEKVASVTCSKCREILFKNNDEKKREAEAKTVEIQRQLEEQNAQAKQKAVVVSHIVDHVKTTQTET